MNDEKAVKKTDAHVAKANEAVKKAAVTAALKATIEADNEIAQRNAEKEYIVQKKKHMLERCKKDKKVTFVGNKIYAQYFGKTYTFLYNGIPVTVKFDGSKQEFPEFIAKKIQDKIYRVSEDSTPKDIVEDRTK